jgi:hypothetical protein
MVSAVALSVVNASLPMMKPNLIFVQEDVQSRTKQEQNCELRKLFLPHVLAGDGFEVLKGLLTCDPSNRLASTVARYSFHGSSPPTSLAAVQH